MLHTILERNESIIYEGMRNPNVHHFGVWNEVKNTCNNQNDKHINVNSSVFHAK